MEAGLYHGLSVMLCEAWSKLGDPKRIRKKYETPGHPWRADVLAEELKLLGEYGLRNKRELWRTASVLRRVRAQARALFSVTGERKRQQEEKLIGKLNRMGILPEGAVLDDVLRLTVRDFLERRLQTMVYRLGLARTLYQARQFIVHGHVFVGERKVRSPSYHVMRGEEDKIRLVLPSKQEQSTSPAS